MEKEIVHVTATGNKYHNDGCSYLPQNEDEIDKKIFSMPLERAKRVGYEPCKFCIEIEKRKEDLN